MSTTHDTVRQLASWLDERKGVDIRALDLTGLSGITEAMVVVTATSVRHAQGMADHLLDKAAETGVEYLGMEGHATGQWILVDFNDVLVHIFQEQDRAFYDLEGLWSEAPDISLTTPDGA